MRAKFYVGFKPDHTMEVFKSLDTPKQSEYEGVYFGVIGPFRTKRGATFMMMFGRDNPHCQTVSDAERLAKLSPDGFQLRDE